MTQKIFCGVIWVIQTYIMIQSDTKVGYEPEQLPLPRMHHAMNLSAAHMELRQHTHTHPREIRNSRGGNIRGEMETCMYPHIEREKERKKERERGFAPRNGQLHDQGYPERND